MACPPIKTELVHQVRWRPVSQIQLIECKGQETHVPFSEFKTTICALNFLLFV